CILVTLCNLSARARTCSDIYTLSLHDALPIFADKFLRLSLAHQLQWYYNYRCVRVVGILCCLSSTPILAVGNVFCLLHLDTIVVDRKSTRLNSSHVKTSYAVLCVNKKDKATHD